MPMFRSSAVRLLSLGVLFACTSLWVNAGKPDRIEEGQHGKHAREKRQDQGHGRDDRQQVQAASPGVSVQIRIGGYFGDSHRRAALAYYEPQFKAGKCPPGLAKKGNGCMPPGQVRKWRRGYALPSDVVYYPVPGSVSVQLGLPPAGHKYVRVAADILLIAVGTGMVVDAIEDLGRL